MTIWQHAYRAVSRRRRKSLILAGLITIISCVFILQGVILATLTDVLQTAEERVSPGMTLSTSGNDFRQEAATPLLDTPGVTGHHFQLHTSAEGESGTYLPVTDSDNPAELGAFARGDARLADGSETALDKLKAGRGAIIDKATAKQRKLAVGDTLDLSRDEARVSVPVVGIYTASESAAGSETPLYTDLATAQELAGKQALSEATYLTAARAEVPALIEKAQQGLQLEDNAASVAGILDSVSGLTSTLTRLLWALVAANAAILVLVLVFWTRARIHEIGVLLAIGQSKRVISLRFFTEMLLIAAPSFLLALMLGEAGGYAMAGYIHRTIALGGTTASHTSGAALAFAALLAAVGVLLLLIVALGMTLVPIMRRHPRDILSTLS